MKNLWFLEYFYFVVIYFLKKFYSVMFTDDKCFFGTFRFYFALIGESISSSWRLAASSKIAVSSRIESPKEFLS